MTLCSSWYAPRSVIKLNHCSCSGFCALSFHCAPIMALVFGRTTKEEIVSNQASSCTVVVALFV